MSKARDRSFVRKVIYLVAMGLLLMPLFWLSQPATQGTKQQRGQPGGKLARLRDEYRLNQTELGQIDPTSETIRLTTLGMRGIACTLLWSKANTYQMKKDWTNLRATLEQISKLQPHSTTVWRFQAWNLSYNVSVAFDDYHDKYYWVIEGLKFLEHGVSLNEFEPRLAWDMAWFLSNKIGKDDMAKHYRRLFREDVDRTPPDPEFQKLCQPADGVPPNLDIRDNWHMGKAWYLSAEKKIDERHPVRGMAEVIFFSDAPMCQYYYSEALEKDGRFGEVARRAWRQAAIDWKEFGQREFRVSDDVTIRLNDQEMHEDKVWEDAEAIDKWAPGVWAKLKDEKLAKLAPDEQAAWKAWAAGKSEKQIRLGREEDERMFIAEDEVARRVKEPHHKEALKLAEDARRHRDMIGEVRRERSKVNFDFWRLRAEMEQTPKALEAREAGYKAEQAVAHGDLLAARAAYDRALLAWRWVLDKFPTLKDDPAMGGDLMDLIRRYAKFLKQNAAPNEKGDLPKPFILQDILDRYQNRR